MQKHLAIFLMLLLSVLSEGTAQASINNERKAAQFRTQVESLPLGVNLVIGLKDHRKVEGELVSYSEESLSLRNHESVKIAFADIRNVTEIPAAQTNPGSSQYPAGRKHHYVRTLVITLAVCFTFALVVAIASK